MRPGVNVFIAMTTLVVATSCASYYHTHSEFNREFETGDLRQAFETLQRNDRLANSKTKFIYYANNGLLLSILGRYKESNEYFEKAFIFGEDYRINYVYEAAAYFTNPLITTYRGEDHEHLMVLYYKAINFLKMEKYEEALVECRRLNIRLQQLSDKYSSERKYQRDAFIHNLMGIIYQAAGDYNNAFIAYRNALEVYEGDYGRLFGIPAPEQLKRDLVNTAYWTGFTEEYDYYKRALGFDDYTPAKPDAELVFFWHNGLCPIKAEWSINFVIQRQGDDMVMFSNADLGLQFPFHVNEDERTNLSRLEVFRVAFPRYVERPEYFQSAAIKKDEEEYPLEVAEDINKIAIHSLRERMMLEFSKGLLRAALKKATEHSMRKEDESLGALIGIINAMTEHADTRNWQTLPHSISYARVPLQEGENKMDFLMNASTQVAEHSFTYVARRGQTLFHTFSSLESAGAPTFRY